MRRRLQVVERAGGSGLRETCAHQAPQWLGQRLKASVRKRPVIPWLFHWLPHTSTCSRYGHYPELFSRLPGFRFRASRQGLVSAPPCQHTCPEVRCWQDGKICRRTAEWMPSAATATSEALVLSSKKAPRFFRLFQLYFTEVVLTPAGRAPSVQLLQRSRWIPRLGTKIP